MPENSSDPVSQNELQQTTEILTRINQAIGKQVVGQEGLRSRLLIALLTGGHLLLEGVPGLAKTLSIKSLSQAVDGSFNRIQFTPDLLPADLTGTEVFRPQDGQFEVRTGPVFANFVLADEINRAPAKVQAALLETMQELQVTIGSETFALPRPFLVLATQNPIEQEGTYPLPEAQVDRFMMKVRVDYPTAKDELEMLNRVDTHELQNSRIVPVASLEEIHLLRNLCSRIYADPKVKEYIIKLVSATRNPQDSDIDLSALVELGASPRASIALLQGARADAIISGNNYISPQNVKNVSHDVLRHRIIPTYEADAQEIRTDSLIDMVLDKVAVP